MERRISASSDSTHPEYLDDSVSAQPCCIAGTSLQVAEASAPQTTTQEGSLAALLTPASPILVNTLRRETAVSRSLNSDSEGCSAAVVHPGGPDVSLGNGIDARLYSYNPRAHLDAEHDCVSSSDSDEDNSGNVSGEDEWWVLSGADSDQEDGSFSEEGNGQEIGDSGIAADPSTSGRRQSDDSVNTSTQGHRSHHRYSGTGVHVSHVHIALGVSKRHSAANIRRRHRRKRYVESLRRSNIDLHDENSRLREFLAHLEGRAPSS